jgi:hypothetical protein
MVFLIQNTQNLDSEAMQVKLDELIRSIEGAHNALLDLEGLEEDELDRIRDKYQQLAKLARADLRRGRIDTGSPVTDGEGQPDQRPRKHAASLGDDGKSSGRPG